METCRVGSTGESVRQLQDALVRAGYLAGGVDGIFGPATQDAVRRFQTDRGLGADGIVGPATWAALSSPAGQGGGAAPELLRQGSQGDAVRRLQEALAAAGYLSGGADGIFGPATDAAVRRFQTDRGLGADGIVGPATWAALSGQSAPPTPGSPPASGPPASGPPVGTGGGLSSDGAAFIAGHEGCRLQLYNDPVGHCTIGVGHLVHRGPCDGSEPGEFRAGITQERAFEILQADAVSAARAVLESVTVELRQHELDALISFTFNVGGGAFKSSTLLKKLNGGDRGAVPGELARWTKAGSVELPGLVRRRSEEGRLFERGEY